MSNSHYVRTVTDSAVALTSALVLANRWVKAEQDIFGAGKFLSNNNQSFIKLADRLAVTSCIISLYISSRELYETYNNKNLVEKADSYLDIASNAVTTVGLLMTQSAVKVAAPRLLSAFSAFLNPGLGQLLMIIGVGLMLVQVGIYLYREWTEGGFRRDGAVGYYFWEEFEAVRERSQRY